MIVITLLLYLVVGVIFTAFVALVFSALTLLLGLISPDFEVTGPEGWKFRDFYVRYLIVAGVYTLLTLPLGGWIGWGALIVTYKYVFDAGWLQALVIGGVGGIIAVVLFVFMMVLVLQPLGLIEAEPSYELDEEFEEIDLESLENSEEQSYHPTAPGVPRGISAMLGPVSIVRPAGGHLMPRLWLGTQYPLQA